MAGLFEFESQKNNLQDRYGQDQATNDYARFVSQQRFNRQKTDMNKGFQRNFPRFTAQGAQRLGSGVRSGVFNQALGNQVQDFNQGLQDVDQDQAGFEANWQTQAAGRQSAFQRAMLLLEEQIRAQRAMTDPFAGYVGGP